MSTLQQTEIIQFGKVDFGNKQMIVVGIRKHAEDLLKIKI
jgi:hypothetical protein